MGFRVGKMAKVWKVYPKDKADQKYTDVQISTSKKDKNGYTNDFNDNARLIGDAFEKAVNLEANDRIKIVSCDVTSQYIKESGKKYYRFLIYDFEFEANKKQEKSEAEAKGDEWVDVSAIPESELPFAD